MSLFLDINVGDTVIIGSNIKVTLEHKSGRRSRIKVDADKDMPIKLEPKKNNLLDTGYARRNR